MLVVLTEWNEFRALDLKRVREVMIGNVLVDLRNMYPEALAEEAGFVYYGVGRTLPPLVSRGANRRRDSRPRAGTSAKSPIRTPGFRSNVRPPRRARRRSCPA